MSTTTAADGWLQSITSEPSRAIAARTGLAHSTITRAANTNTPPPGVVVAVARAYDYDVLRALVLTGFLTPDETTGHGMDTALQHAPTAMLLHELLRREHNKH